MPKQFYALALLLSLYHWPWLLFSGDTAQSWLASVITMQLAFVISCNKLTDEDWATGLIILEGVSMIANIMLAILSYEIFHWHSDFMLAAFIIELLIIAISLTPEGASVDSRSAPNSLRNILWGGINMHYKNRGGAYQ